MHCELGARCPELRDVEPSTPIFDLVDGATFDGWVRDIATRSGLRIELRTLRERRAQLCLTAFSVAGGIGAAWAFLAEAWLLAWLASAAAILVHAMPGFRTRIPDHLRTYGDVLRASLHLNYRGLSGLHGAGTRADISRAVEGLCRASSGYEGRVTDRTLLIS
jgi:hypothetical protein